MVDNNKPKNPWGQSPQNNNRPPNKKPSSDMPDIDALLKRARDNFNFGQGGDDNGKKIIVIGLLLLAALWLASGLYRVEPSENAVVQRFGDYSRTQAEAGMGYHLPWPIESVSMVNVTEDRRVTIGFGDTAAGRPMANRSDVADESLMLTSDANIVDIDVVVLWNISDAQNYLFNIKDQEETVKRVAESTIREVVGQTRLQPIITTGREDVSQRAKQLTQAILDSYGAGISIKQILIQDATVHPNVMEAFDDVVAAGQDAERFQNEANIYKNDILPKARGEAIKMIQQAEAYKEARVARSQGEAERFNKLYQAYQSGRDVTRERIFIETMEDVFRTNDKIIIQQQEGGQGVLPYLPLNRQNQGGQ